MWLSRSGADEIQNMVLVCPNHHAAIHMDAPLDFVDLSFDFGTHRENLSLRKHLEAV
jgi:hypothetical protein